MQSEYTFRLPKGYKREDGMLLRNGIMRLATAKDEIEAMRHPKVKTAPEYATVVLLSSVIISLEDCHELTVEMIENMYTADVNFLQNMYETINSNEDMLMHVVCPHCGKEFEDTINFTQQD